MKKVWWIILAVVVFALIVLLYYLFFSFNKCDLPGRCGDNETLVGGCAGVQNIHWQECCDNWAAENGIAHVMCLGNWTVENNKCVWKCG